MTVYIKTQKGDTLVKLGKILTIGSVKRTCLLTGDDEKNLVPLGVYESEEGAKAVMSEITLRIIQPTAREIEKGIIFIDLEEIE